MTSTDVPPQTHTHAAGTTSVPAEQPRPQADPKRLTSMLREIAQTGEDPTGGITRLAYSPQERAAHALVNGWLAELGLSVHTDDAGNTIAERAGKTAGLPAIGMGSHLDSVPHGGRYDGIVGVVAAIETIRLLTQTNVVTEHPLRVVIFAAEEGARFGEPCIGSKIVSGALAHRSLEQVRDTSGTSLAQAMSAVGIDPARAAKTRWNAREWAAFLEMHIEQARVLEDEGREIGLVDQVSGSTRLRVILRGRADHSGGTPMDLRADALTAAAELILAAESIARDPRHRGTRTTVGQLEVYPNSLTTIPGRVTLGVDVRDVDSDRQRETATTILRAAAQICDRRGIQMETQLLADTSPVVLPMWVREIVAGVTTDLGVNARIITSGAGHDAQVINRIIPSGMIFVPSKEGLSHVPEEWTSAAAIVRGVDVLYESVLRIDSFLVSLQR